MTKFEAPSRRRVNPYAHARSLGISLQWAWQDDLPVKLPLEGPSVRAHGRHRDVVGCQHTRVGVLARCVEDQPENVWRLGDGDKGRRVAMVKDRSGGDSRRSFRCWGWGWGSRTNPSKQAAEPHGQACELSALCERCRADGRDWGWRLWCAGWSIQLSSNPFLTGGKNGTFGRRCQSPCAASWCRRAHRSAGSG